MYRRFPRYPDDADYQTNAPSYYEDLARKNKLIKKLAKRIWEYDKILADSLEEIEEVLRQVIDKIGEDFNEEIYQLLVKWVEDGTLDHIINETIFNSKADQSALEETNKQVKQNTNKTTQLNVLNYKEYVNNIGQVNEDWSPAFEKMFEDVDILNVYTIELPNQTLQTYSPITYSGKRNIVFSGGGGTKIKAMGNFNCIEITDTSVYVNFHFINLEGTNKQGIGVMTKGNSRKINFVGCEIKGFKYGLAMSSSWTINTTRCNIHDNENGILIYRLNKGAKETTTINIKDNTIWQNDNYNILVGDMSLPDSESGVQTTTLNIRDNMLDNAPCLLNGVIVNLNYTGNHSEFVDTAFITLTGTSISTTIKENYFASGGVGIKYIGNDHRNCTIEENMFRNMDIAMDLKEVRGTRVKIGMNYYQEVKERIAYPYISSRKEVADNIYQTAEDFNIENGKMIYYGDDLPDGRFKKGTVVYIKDSEEKHIFECDEWGLSRTENLQTFGKTENGFGYPDNLTKFKHGDRLTITGSGDSNNDLECVITSVDYINNRISTDPSIKSDNLNAKFIHSSGSWKPLSNTAWTSMVFENDWESSVIARYRLNTNGNVEFKGTIANGKVTAGTVIFTLPNGYRPKQTTYINTSTWLDSQVKQQVLKVTSDGKVSIYATDALNDISLNNVQFPRS